MSLLQGILYGFISGVTEFLPVSSRVHQSLLRYIFGLDRIDHVQNLAVHIGVFVSVIVGCYEVLQQLKREQKSHTASRRRIRSADMRSLYDLRLLKTATVLLIVGLTLNFVTNKFVYSLPLQACFLILNAFFLLLAEHTRHGNRDSRTMTGLDGIVMGISGSLSVLPGVSRTGMISAYAVARGADSTHAANWSVLLAIPAMVFASCMDITGITVDGAGTISLLSIVGFALSGIFAFLGGYAGISLFKTALKHSGFSGFAYYSIGAALFSFVLYLIT